MIPSEIERVFDKISIAESLVRYLGAFKTGAANVITHFEKIAKDKATAAPVRDFIVKSGLPLARDLQKKVNAAHTAGDNIADSAKAKITAQPDAASYAKLYAAPLCVLAADIVPAIDKLEAAVNAKPEFRTMAKSSGKYLEFNATKANFAKQLAAFKSDTDSLHKPPARPAAPAPAKPAAAPKPAALASPAAAKKPAKPLPIPPKK